MNSVLLILAVQVVTVEATGVKVLFGHQSVGANILEGVTNVHVGKPADIPKGGEVLIAESFVGENEKPLTKIEDFERLVTENKDTLNAAMFKFCYIDFNAQTDVPALFAAYEAAHERLAKAYPQITFAHVTTPLTIVQSGPKAWLKQLMGKAPWGYVENQKRAEFNALLRAKYTRVFDLADLEARDEHGEPVSYAVGNARFPMLFEGYSSDGGHLSQRGKQKIGAAFSAFVTSLRQ